MSDVTNEAKDQIDAAAEVAADAVGTAADAAAQAASAAAPAVNAAAEAADATVRAVSAAAKVQGAKVRNALGVLKKHPLGLVVAIGAAAALVEIELAVGMLAGIGATALLVTKSGPEARQDVVAKSKAALERARVALTSRANPQPAGAAPAAEPPPAAEPNQAPAA